MTGFLLSPAAVADVEAVESFLDHHAPHATATVLIALRNGMRRIAVTPCIGHLREDLVDEPLRFYTVWSYLVIYRVTDPVEIVRVLHAARDVTDELTSPPR